MIRPPNNMLPARDDVDSTRASSRLCFHDHLLSLCVILWQHLEGMIGNAGFDPLGLSTPQNIKWMREAELKHGRMCQLAWTVRCQSRSNCIVKQCHHAKPSNHVSCMR